MLTFNVLLLENFWKYFFLNSSEERYFDRGFRSNTNNSLLFEKKSKASLK